MEQRGTKPIVERNPSVDLLVAEAAKHKEEPGWTFTYADMTRIAGGERVSDIREANSVLRSWLKVMLRDHGMVFAAVANVGYRLCDDSGKVDVMQHRVKKARRQCKTALHVATVVDTSKLEAHRRGDYARAMASAHLAARELSLNARALTDKRVARLPEGKRDAIKKMLGLN